MSALLSLTAAKKSDGVCPAPPFPLLTKPATPATPSHLRSSSPSSSPGYIYHGSLTPNTSPPCPISASPLALKMFASDDDPVSSSAAHIPYTQIDDAASVDDDLLSEENRDADAVFADFVRDDHSEDDQRPQQATVSPPLNKRRQRQRQPSASSDLSVFNFHTDDEADSQLTSPVSSLASSPLRKKRKRGSLTEDPNEQTTTRRSGRTRVQPLEYWKNERIVYNLVQADDGVVVPTIKSIVRAETVKSKRKTSTASASPARKRANTPTQGAEIGRKKTLKPNNTSDVSDRDSSRVFSEGPEETQQSTQQSTQLELPAAADDSEFDCFVAEVEDLSACQRIPRQIAVPSTMLPYTAVRNKASRFDFAKTFEEDRGFLATGIVRLPANSGCKGRKKTGLNALTFCVIEGTVEVFINDDVRFKISRGGHFLVPRLNSYALHNAGRKMCVLFYAQATDTFCNIVEGGKAGTPAADEADQVDSAEGEMSDHEEEVESSSATDEDEEDDEGEGEEDR
ncbi:Mif2/CENP-C like-domain-containing protein [Myxozyma melibiosi]|uniref:Mif2/CENP-C like-domain-containing protein n=1 Tax=Myxozyma melibiosi TaxID=54550 RepID=A0ABR1FC95_9ASCO